MKLFQTSLVVLGLILMPSMSSACSFCSSKPKGLSSDGPVQDPGAKTLSASAGAGVVAPGQTVNSRGSNSPFTYDLKNYKPDGQRSNNEKWSSGDFFDNR
jgi:hypothetical protein